MSSASAPTGESRIQILGDATSLAHSVIRTIRRTKHLTKRDWLFAFFSKMTQASHAIRLVLEGGYPEEAKLLVRANWDAFLDLAYLLHDRTKIHELESLIENEAVIDTYEQLKFMADREGTPFKEFIRNWGEAREVLQQYKRIQREIAGAAKAHKTNRRGVKHKPVLWQDIKVSSKRIAIKDLGNELDRFHYTIRTLGHASAHARPAVLLSHLPGRDRRKLRRTVLGSLYSIEWIAFEATLCLLFACDKMVDHWFLGRRLENRIQALISRLWTARKIT